MLGKLVDAVPSRLVYRVLETPVGRSLYERGFTDTRPRTVTCPEATFEMQMPSNGLYLWDDFTPGGCHEPLTTRTMLATLTGPDAATVWDVGSKCGYFMMVAAQATLAERVHVFEPTSPHVQVIHENNDRYLDGGARINRTTVGDTEEDGGTTEDAYATRHGPPDLVKIDVDGPEVSVLRGLIEALGAHSPALLVEVHLGDDWDRKRARLGALLDTHPYEFRVARNHRDTDEEWQQIDTIGELAATTGRDFLLRCVVPEREVDSAW